jgi:O-antigen/teichoic acid export membrane protein
VPVGLIAATTALAAPLLPLVLGEAYEGSVDVMRVTCATAVLSGAGTMLGFMVQGHSTGAARTAGHVTLAFAVVQVLAAGVGAWLDGAVLGAVLVAVVNGLLALTLYVQARRVAVS